jgi:hypothetical protein
MYGQTRADLAPFRDLGAGAGSSLSKLLGIGQPAVTAPKVGDLNVDAFLKANPDIEKYYQATPAAQTLSLNDFAKNVGQQQASVRGAIPTYTASDVADWRSPTDQALEQLPGYQFARNQGIQSVNRSLGSMGLTGAQAKGISRFVTGLADSTYNGQVKNLQDFTNTGENAAAQTGSIGSTYGSNIGNNIVGAGTASASGTVGAANAASGALGQIPSYLLANKLLGGGGGGGGGAGIYGGSGGVTSIPASADFGG